MSKRRGRIKDKWRDKKWYNVVSPPYFGGVDLGAVPSDDPNKLVGRIVDGTLYDITNDFAHQYLKLYFRIEDVEGKTARTVFKGHEYSRDFLRSLVRRRTTRVDGIFNVTTNDNFGLTLAVSVFTLSRIKTSQEHDIRAIMSKIVKEKSSTLNFSIMDVCENKTPLFFFFLNVKSSKNRSY